VPSARPPAQGIDEPCPTTGDANEGPAAPPPHRSAAVTPSAFARLLAWLDDGADTRGESYVALRRRLVWYFERRSSRSADELADETLDRVARTLATEAVAVRPPGRYCFVVARFVLLGDLRRERRRRQLQVDASWHASVHAEPGTGEAEARTAREARLDALDRCQRGLEPAARALIREYYEDAGAARIERRRALAERLGITGNALSIRVWRIREELVRCLEGRPAARRGKCRKKSPVSTLRIQKR
jgi:DNA-directed RNA polymerase specialized sigma24 family protein